MPTAHKVSVNFFLAPNSQRFETLSTGRHTKEGRVAHLFGATLLCALEAFYPMVSPHAETNWARDPRIAMQEEYDLAVKRGTVEALELFILRHPDSELVAAATALIRARKSDGTKEERR